MSLRDGASKVDMRPPTGSGRFIQRGYRPQAWSAPMDKTTLVEPYIEEGRRFLKLFDAAGVRVNAALWQKEQLSSQWQLLIVTPLVEELGVKGTYRRLDEILSKAPQ